MIVADLTEVGILTSIGLSMLIEAEQTASGSGQRLRVVAGAPRVVARSLEMTGLADQSSFAAISRLHSGPLDNACSSELWATACAVTPSTASIDAAVRHDDQLRTVVDAATRLQFLCSAQAVGMSMAEGEMVCISRSKPTRSGWQKPVDRLVACMGEPFASGRSWAAASLDSGTRSCRRENHLSLLTGSSLRPESAISAGWRRVRWR
jgi:hypothetical protein